MSMLLLLLAAHAAAAPVVLRSGPRQARLIELYSSEGCSSCPPADAWLRALSGHPRLWKDFVPVAFQVAYWDHLGWKDALADPSHEKRQRAYAASWGTGTVYTPGFVLDGREWRDWRDGVPSAGEKSGVLTVRIDEGAANGRFESDGEGPYDLTAARLGSGLVSVVRRGENGGTRMAHDFVVRGLSTARMAKKNGAWTAVLPIPPGPAPLGSPSVAIWVVGPDGRPVQAVGGPLPAN